MVSQDTHDRPDPHIGGRALQSVGVMLSAICHQGSTWTEVHDLTTISDLLERPGVLVWAMADSRELTADDMALLADELGLHPLAVEDALSLRQRPKLESYETHLFAVMHQLDSVEGQLEARQIACFVGRRFVLTFHAGAERLVEEARKRCMLGAKDPDQGPSYVMHALLDTVVDDYQDISDSLELEVEELEEKVLGQPLASGLEHRLYSLKQRLARLRRYVIPGERVLTVVQEPARFSLITDRTAALFRDVHDHLLRVIDQIRNVDDLVEAVINLQQSAQAQSLNEVTKRLTGWAAIIAVPTFIASVYGMNFELVPSEGQLFGFWFALGLMAITGVGLFAYFKRRGWI
jgi:magnesium transporter